MLKKLFRHKECILLVLILLIGAVLRFYQIRGHATFLGDEGRDALIVRDMIVNHKFTLLGPTISFGNLYLGPIYYYLMLIPLWLSQLDPVGPAIMVGAFGVAAIFMIWLVAKKFFGTTAALTSSSLYAVSPLIINHTRSSWNPNPVPFFALLAVYGLYQSIKYKSKIWFFVLGACLGIMLQLHYMTLVFLISVVIIFLILRPKLKLTSYLCGIAGLVLMLAPQAAFELRHNFINVKAAVDLLQGTGEFTGLARVGLDRMSPLSIFQRLFAHILVPDIPWLGILIGITTGIVVLVSIVLNNKSHSKNLGLILLFLWSVLGVVGVSLYKGTMNDHYLGFLFPAPFLLIGFVSESAWKHRRLRPVIILIIIILSIINLKQTNIFKRQGPNNQIARTQEIAKAIADDVGNRKYNIAIVSATHDFLAMNYRYFLTYFGKIPQDYSNFRDIDVLYVIEETSWVDPDNLSLWETGTFGPFQATKQWIFDFQIQIYRLDHKK